MSGSDRPERATPLVQPLDRWVIGGLVVLIAATFAWLVFGSVEDVVQGRGLVIRDSEFGIFEVAGTTPGRVSQVLFKEGDTVKAGDVVATLHLPELLAEITTKEERLKQLQSSAADSPAIPGLELELEELRLRHQNQSAIRSPRDGRVIEVVISAGNVIPAGRTILRLESLTGAFEVLAYVSVGQGKKIEPGMTVRVVPSTVHSEVSGHLKGRVNYVSAYPVTRDYLISELGGNIRLADYLLEKGSCIEVDIDLLKDPDSGTFAWSTHGAHSVKIESGLVVEAFVVVSERRPISLLLSSAK